jgi:beta-glucosidase
MFANGLFDIPPSGSEDTNVTSARHSALARTLAAAGTVLLKNDAGVLPLADDVKNIVVVGAAADATPYCCGSGSGGLSPPYVVTPLDGIRARAGSANVSYVLSDTFANVSTWFSATRGDHFLDFACDECYGIYVDVRSEGFLSTGECPAELGCVELALWWNAASQSNLVIPAAPSSYTPPAGYAYVRTLGYALPLSYTGALPTQVLELWSGMDTPTGAAPNSHLDFWTLASDASRAEATAKGYRKVLDVGRVLLAPLSPAPPAVDGVVIIVVSTPSSEGLDRADLNLAAADDALIASWAAANPTNTIVVLNNPGAVVMPWSGAASAILAAWFPGQEMVNALADILWGDVNPSARLPLTFPASNADTPLANASQYPGIDGEVFYSERLNIGYRYWDSAKIEPLFCFGHGLSYTSFTYSALTIDSAVAAPNVTVTFTVTNAGAVSGREIPQLYVSFPAAAGEPPSQLRGFTAIGTLPGESVNVSFALAPRDLSIWDVDVHDWALVKGTFGVSVGASSRDARLSGSFVV